MLESVLSAATTRPRSARAHPAQAPTIATVSVSLRLARFGNAHRNTSATISAGRPPASERTTIRVSWRGGRRAVVTTGGGSQAVALDPAIERAAREPERPGRLAHVTVEALEGAPDQLALRLVERQVIEGRTAFHRPEAEIDRAHLVARCEQHRALDGVIQLAHVAGPGVRAQRLQGF